MDGQSYHAKSLACSKCLFGGARFFIANSCGFIGVQIVDIELTEHTILIFSAIY
jgi:hypothetical protein